MELKAILKVPYTEVQRLDFIAEQSHVNFYEIRETKDELQAWGLTEEEKAQKEKEAQIALLKAQLVKVDEKSSRSIRAIVAGTATEEDRTFLENLEIQAEDLRRQIKELQDASGE